MPRRSWCTSVLPHWSSYAVSVLCMFIAHIVRPKFGCCVITMLCTFCMLGKLHMFIFSDQRATRTRERENVCGTFLKLIWISHQWLIIITSYLFGKCNFIFFHYYICGCPLVCLARGSPEGPPVVAPPAGFIFSVWINWSSETWSRLLHFWMSACTESQTSVVSPSRWSWWHCGMGGLPKWLYL